MRDVARSIASARFFGSVMVGLLMRERQSTVTRPFRDTERLEEVCRLAAMMNSSYRDLCRVISRELDVEVRLRPACPVEHADEPCAGSAAALLGGDLGVDLQGELGV